MTAVDRPAGPGGISFSHCVLVTPNDTTDLANGLVAEGILVTSADAATTPAVVASIDTPGGESALLLQLRVGEVHRIRFNRVRLTGTTAVLVYALY